MRVRFLGDENIERAIVEGVRRREPEIDIKGAAEAGILGAPDSEVLAAAASEKRVLVTHDVRTMPYHFADFVAESDSAGVIVVTQNVRIGWIVDELVGIWQVSGAEDWVNQISSLPYLPTVRPKD